MCVCVPVDDIHLGLCYLRVCEYVCMLCRFLALVFFMCLLISPCRTVPSEVGGYSIVYCSKSETSMKPNLIFSLTFFFF